MILYRGQVVQAHFGDLDEPKLFLIVSNNGRNRALRSALTVRLTTTRKKPQTSIVEIPESESVHGRVLCDDIEVIHEEDVLQVRTALSPRTMQAVDRGLAAALGLPAR